MIFYLFFSLLFTLLGFYCFSNKERAFKFYFILIVLLPLGGGFSDLFVKSTVAVYEFFYIGLCSKFLFYSINRKAFSKILIFSVLLSLLLISTGFLKGNPLEFIVKDFKPFLVIIVALIFLRSVKKVDTIFTYNELRLLLLLNLIKVIVIYILGNYFGLNERLNDDFYYIQNPEFRYADLGTIFVSFYFIYKLSNKMRFNLLDIASIIIPIFVTQQRTLMIALILIVITFYIFNAKMLNKLLILISFPAIGYLVYSTVGGRFFDVFNSELLVKLLSNRFSPFFNELSEFSTVVDYLLGNGFGKPFYIPWFEYRENINNFNPNIDNLYLTYFMKFGLFSLFILLYMFLVFKKNMFNKVYSRYLLLYFLILGLTTAFSYQLSFIFLLTFPVLISEKSKV